MTNDKWKMENCIYLRYTIPYFMNNTIVCPHCKKNVPLNDALAHEIREEIAEKARVQLIEDRRKLQAQFDLEKKKNQEEQLLSEKKLEEKIRKKIEEDMSVKTRDTNNALEEKNKQNHELQNQLLELTRSMRDLQQKMSEKDLEVEKKLLQEQEKIKQDVQKRVEDEFKYKLLEKEKQINDARKMADDYKRKLEQGSQQLQGEVLELEIENILHAEFPTDEITAVAKGVRGGDVIHIVKNGQGQKLGIILWELKRTKTWSNDWIGKLKDDQRALKAEMAAIVSDIIPNDIKNFGWREGVWIGNLGSMTGLAHALRRHIMEIALLRQAADGKKEKMEVLYNYIYGTEFRQRIEAIVEAFQSLQEDAEREKRFFAAKWAKQEKNIRKVMDNTFGMHGDLESITGQTLAIKELDLLAAGEDKIEDEISQEQLL